MRIRLAAVFLLAAAVGFYPRLSRGAVVGIEVRDLGLFVVANSFPANGTSAPLPLVAGHWADRVNVTITDGLPHVVNFRLSFNLTLALDVNSTMARTGPIYLDFGTDACDDFSLYLKWT